MYQIIKQFIRPDHIKMIEDLAIHADWSEGRQETGYYKSPIRYVASVQEYINRALKLLNSYDGFWDAYLLSYPDGAHIPPHKDDTGFGREKHMRLNALISKPKDGGLLTIDDEVINLDIGDAVIFVPNMSVHSVSNVVGSRLVLSVGCWI